VASVIQDMNNYIAGGFFVVPRISRPADASDLLPRNILTVSSCLATIVPDTWAVDLGYPADEDRADGATKLSIAPALIPDLVKWVTAEIGPDPPSAFHSLTAAREFHRRFITQPGVLVIGIGLHRSLRDSFDAQIDKDPTKGHGLLERVQQNDLLPGGGIVLGYEPLGFCGGSFHTWLCNISADQVNKRLGIRPNENGLISTVEEGTRVVHYITEAGAEPAIWEPWMVVEYPPVDPTELSKN
jgi:hypothetical protein